MNFEFRVEVAFGPRQHLVTFREIIAPGELCHKPEILAPDENSFFDAPLPAKGLYAIFCLQTGPKPTRRTVTAVLDFDSIKGIRVEVRANGVLCEPARVDAESEKLHFSVPESALSDECGSGLLCPV